MEKPFSRLVFAILFAFASLAMMVGALLGSISESSNSTGTKNAATPAPTIMMYLPPPTPTFTPTFTVTPSPSPIACQPPEGWTAIVTRPDDTVAGLAASYLLSAESFSMANCVPPDLFLAPGTILFVPAVIPAPTNTPAAAE